MFNYRNSAKSDHPPHVFAMANNAYHAMIHEKRNQVKNIVNIFFCFFSGKFWTDDSTFLEEGHLHHLNGSADGG